jgi:hypothetical protein
MRQARLMTCLLAAGFWSAPGLAASGPPQVVSRTQLSALPVNLSVGQAGPFNRIAFDVEQFGPPDPSSTVTCTYPGELRYRCDAAVGEPEAGGTKRRVIVTIPDLGRGKRVVVRFSTSQGRQDAVVELANVSQVVHEIESMPLPGGGQAAIGSTGASAPVLQVVSHKSTTTPAMAASSLGAAPACDQVSAEWVGTSATDPVFQSQFGALNGSVVPSRPVTAGSRVQPDNLPEWLVTFPLSATRVQFIAHYEVIYRVGSCPQRIIRD